MVRVEDLYSVLDRGTECFSLARPFRIAWGGEKTDFVLRHFALDVIDLGG